MNLEHLETNLADLKKRRETAEGHTINQLDAAIASVESQIAEMKPKEAPVDEEAPVAEEPAKEKPETKPAG
jgi:uncharacterized protein involved in exopolysaccharide biosynthesis